VREDLESTGDYAAALRGFPKEWGFEKAILNRLATRVTATVREESVR